MIGLLKQIISDFQQRFPFPNVVDRDLQIPLEAGKVVTIIGPRRSGKTFLLRGMINKLVENVPPKHILYLNFEDERLSLGAEDLQSIIDAQLQLHPNVDLSKCWFFLDEIQVVKKWEQFVRRLEENVSKRIFITGSSADLLSREIATSLRGRTITYTLLPLSFREYARFREVNIRDAHSTQNRNRLISEFDRFVTRGGFPEVIDSSEELHRRILQGYEDIMIFRDVIERHQISRPAIVKDLMKRLLANTSRTFSINKYYNELKSRNVAVGKDTLYELLDHLVEAFAVFPVHKWDPSQVKREQAIRKIYACDTGIVTACTYQTSEDLGHLLETAIYLELAKRERRTFYYRDSAGECDFISEWRGDNKAIQVCYELTPDNRKREVEGLVAATKRLGLEKGLIITHHQNEQIQTNGVEINVVSAWQWALCPLPDQEN
jgi:hypothetical protein